MEKPVKKRILFEDNHLIIVNKLPGELVQGDFTGDKPLLEKVRDYIREEYNKQGNVFTGLVHRLDRPTSGVVIFTKTSKALARMNAIFEKRDVEKIYWAIVKGSPQKEEGRLEHYLRKNQKKNKSEYFFKPITGGKRAALFYKVVKKLEQYSVLEIRLETGRHHQIRVQLSAMGCPIKGDLKYGFSRSNKDASVCLHAKKVIFEHPVSKETVVIEAPLPTGENIWKFV